MTAVRALGIAAAAAALGLTFCHPTEPPPVPPPRPTNPTNVSLAMAGVQVGPAAGRVEQQAADMDLLDASIVTEGGGGGWDGDFELDTGAQSAPAAPRAR
jgi:hypothetical protein